MGLAPMRFFRWASHVLSEITKLAKNFSKRYLKILRKLVILYFIFDNLIKKQKRYYLFHNF